MAERKYSVAEIDRMRGALVSMCSSDREAEDRLRTYMLNGTEPDELEEAADEDLRRRHRVYCDAMGNATNPPAHA